MSCVQVAWPTADSLTLKNSRPSRYQRMSWRASSRRSITTL
ncbi:MAG TPA: hypothetical protein VGG75_23790 [Trebonia sp.]